MATNNANSTAQLSLFPQEGSCVKDAQNGNQQIAKLSTYLKTRGGLTRLIMLFPDKTVKEALRLAPSVLTKCREEETL